MKGLRTKSRAMAPLFFRLHIGYKAEQFLTFSGIGRACLAISLSLPSLYFSLHDLCTSCGSRTPVSFSSAKQKQQTRAVQPIFCFVLLASGCGANLIGPSGEIKSPNYPNNYGNNQECTWQITVPVNKQVRLDFSDFKTESGKDVLQVFDTGSREPVITFSGTTYKPPPITSSGRSLRIRLITDGANTMKGFKLAYSQVGKFHELQLS